MARIKQAPMTVEQIQLEIDNWNSVYDAGLLPFAEFQKVTTKLKRLLERRERERARHTVSKGTQEGLDLVLKRLRDRN